MSLRGVADAKPFAPEDPEIGRVFVAFYSPQKALVLQRPKKPETYGSFHPRPLHNLAERQCLSLVIEFAKHGAGARDRLQFVGTLLSEGSSLPVCRHDAILAPETTFSGASAPSQINCVCRKIHEF